jgi:hypothetical protein
MKEKVAVLESRRPPHESDTKLSKASAVHAASEPYVGNNRAHDLIN